MVQAGSAKVATPMDAELPTNRDSSRPSDASLGRTFGIFLVLYLVLAAPLLTGRDDPNLHTMADTTICLVTGILAWLLWELASRESDPLSWLAVVFAVGAVFELVHALAAIELIESAVPLTLPGRTLEAFDLAGRGAPLAHRHRRGPRAVGERPEAHLKAFGGGTLILGLAVTAPLPRDSPLRSRPLGRG